jgi:hypothetical protein
MPERLVLPFLLALVVDGASVGSLVVLVFVATDPFIV